MSPVTRLLFLEQVLLICASCHENTYNTCIAGPVPDMAVLDWEVPVSDTLGTRYYGSITGTSSCPIKAADSAACISGHGGTAEAMSPVTRLLFLEQVLLICASCHENTYNTCIAGPVPDMAVLDWEVPVSDTLGTRYYESITGTSSCPIKAADSAACISGHGGTAEAMSPVTRLLFLEQVLLICASCHENTYNTCIAGPVPDMAVLDWEVPVSDTLGSRYYGSITGTSSCPIKAANSAACISAVDLRILS
ncbi:uncharacterized protein LOC125942650 [Dermacentor silvarum]|uniref:uncharacterized protein LOC125942650 n=1 Tax=Dermacentor silvarum TaxID=543639 RepID=UPI002100C7B8|nr:uncharacterized protein LOC125942650 [Dermacentor silvarum]